MFSSLEQVCCATTLLPDLFPKLRHVLCALCTLLTFNFRGDWSFDCTWSQAGCYLFPIRRLVNRANIKQAGIKFTIFEVEPSASHYRPREWSMGIHWSLPLLEALLPRDLALRLKEAQNDSFWEAPEHDTLNVYSGLDGKVLKALPLSRIIRVSRRKMRALCSEGIDVKVCA